MDHSPQVAAAAAELRKVGDTRPMEDRFKFLGFCLSLLPIPGIQQAGQALDRHLSDKDVDRRLQSLWDEVIRIDAAAGKVQRLEDSIAQIARVVASSPVLQQQTLVLAQGLAAKQREFSAIAEAGSLQEFLRVLIDAESVYLGAHAGSRTELHGTKVLAERTTLHTTGGSETRVSDTSFHGSQGSVGMHNVSTQGLIGVQGSGVSFGGDGSAIGFAEGGVLSFGAPQTTLTCPRCGTQVQVSHESARPGAQVQCPKCHLIAPVA